MLEITVFPYRTKIVLFQSRQKTVYAQKLTNFAPGYAADRLNMHIKEFILAQYGSYRNLLKKTPPLILTVLVLCVVSMNLLANKELFRASWIALDCGFLLSWIPFLIMDAFCKSYGGADAARISVLAIAINLILFGIFKLVALTPGMWGAYYDTSNPAVNEALNRTIGGSSWIVIGSAAAMAVSSITNSIVNSTIGRVLRKDNFAAFAARSFASTAIAQFVDNFLFALIVSIPLFGWSVVQALTCSCAAAAFELLLEIVFSGAGYRLSKKL